MKLSIAVLTYKHEAYIKQALDGIFMQKISFDSEIIFADDCSPDKTQEIILDYIQRYPERNIRTIFQPKNVGMWENARSLLNACKGEYIAILEGDDYWIDENKLQQQVDFLESNHDYVCCFHTAKVIKDEDSRNKLTFERYPTKPVAETTTIIDILNDGNYIPSASVVLRNIFKGNYPEPIFNTRSFPDAMLHLFLYNKGKYYYINKEMSVYRINVGGITEHINRIAEWEKWVYMVGQSDEFASGKWHHEHQAALQKYYYWLLNSYRATGNKVKIREYLNMIVANKEYDRNYHPNFIRKVWLEEFFPGAKYLLRLLGK
ncbi:hypothetical protein BH09BAC1_BH09BAC1_28980 [soil metagenome]